MFFNWDKTTQEGSFGWSERRRTTQDTTEHSLNFNILTSSIWSLCCTSFFFRFSIQTASICAASGKKICITFYLKCFVNDLNKKKHAKLEKVRQTFDFFPKLFFNIVWLFDVLTRTQHNSRKNAHLFHPHRTAENCVQKQKQYFFVIFAAQLKLVEIHKNMMFLFYL